MVLPEITIIGIGGLGRSLARAFTNANIPVKSLFNRTADKAENLAADLNISLAGSFPKISDELGNLVFITVSDSAISEVANRLATLSDDFTGQKVVHCSGNESAELLDSLKKKGATVASFHPLQTFTAHSGPQNFSDIFFSLQGDEAAFSLLEDVAQQLGAQTLKINEEQKSQLHAAAVIASNYLNTLLDAAIETASIGGLSKDKAKQALWPLIKTTLEHAEQKPFEEALTGPIKRGDVTTVQKHLSLLQGESQLMSVYKTLGLRTIALARKSQSIDNSTARKLIELLQ